MKRALAHISILLAAFTVALLLYENVFRFDESRTEEWKHRKKSAVRSELLSVPILLYHDIDGKGGFSVSLRTLRKQFELIRKRKIRVIPLCELIAHLEDPVPFKGRVMVITFDDGFHSMYTKMLPLVREFKYPVTLFVYTDFIYTSAEESLTWKELREMSSEGIDIESHTVTHRDLLALVHRKRSPDTDRALFNEIYMSKRIVELYLGKRVKYLAFPYGRYNLKVLEFSRKAGYERVFSTDEGANFITWDNYCLRRHHVKKNYSLKLFDRIIQNKR